MTNNKTPYQKKLSPYHRIYEDKFSKVKSQWNKFVTGHEGIDPSIIAPDILNAWQRSRTFGLNPLKKPVPPILSAASLQRLMEDHKPLLQCAGPVIDHFRKFTDSQRSAVCLFTREGYILDVRADEEYQPLVRSLRLVPGALWTEEKTGANAFALAMVLGKPFQFFGPQHYMRAYHGETASAAPVFDPHGQLIGGISLLFSSYHDHPHSLGLAASLALTIENELQKSACLDKAQTTADCQQAVLRATSEAMIALNKDNMVTGINHQALKIMRLNQAVEGKRLTDLLNAGNSDFIKITDNDKMVSDMSVRIIFPSGFGDYLITSSPITAASGEAIGKIIVLKEADAAKKTSAKTNNAKPHFHLKDVCGQNSRFLRTLHYVQMAAKSDSNVLLLGESGTGKDIFAQVIHNSGARKHGPYIAINCASIPRDLIANELFGHSEGAFTGSRRGGNTGKFEAADGGTIFFDEIAETSLEFQSTLLRAVEEKAIVRVGGTSIRPINVRIVAATNKNILEEIRKGAFRSDLYYRLNVFTIETIPLRDRKDDIPLFIANFIKKDIGANGHNITGISEDVIKILSNYPWPGNIRELQNVLERMMNVAHGSELTLDLIPDEILHWQHRNSQKTESNVTKSREKETILHMMSMDIPRNKIAEKMHMARSTFYRKLKVYGLD